LILTRSFQTRTAHKPHGTEDSQRKKNQRDSPIDGHETPNESLLVVLAQIGLLISQLLPWTKSKLPSATPRSQGFISPR
jgi:hypothetical protein